MNERASSCVRAPMSRHCRAASPSAATVSSACTSGEASPYAPKASPRVWPLLPSRPGCKFAAVRESLPTEPRALPWSRCGSASA